LLTFLVKGRYQHLQRRLQHVGTRSAKRKLKALTGRERRFVLNVNHTLSKTIVSKSFNVFAVEQLRNLKKKNNGKRFNSKLGSWSFAQLQTFLQYKAEQISRIVVTVNPRNTSQTCSRCGYTNKANRKSAWFRCGPCGFQLDADLNASRNIGVLGRSEYLRLCVNQPIVASDEPTPAGVTDGSYKPIYSEAGS